MKTLTLTIATFTIIALTTGCAGETLISTELTAVTLEVHRSGTTRLETLVAERSRVEELIEAHIPVLEEVLGGELRRDESDEVVRIVVTVDDAETYEWRVPVAAFFANDSEMLTAVQGLYDELGNDEVDEVDGVRREALTARGFCDWFAGPHDNGGSNDSVYHGCVWFLTGLSEYR